LRQIPKLQGLFKQMTNCHLPKCVRMPRMHLN
jgi:hypothetical protein